MKVDRRLMSARRKYPDKVREIFQTAKNTDMDREEVRIEIDRFASVDTYQFKDVPVLRALGQIPVPPRRTLAYNLLLIPVFLATLPVAIYHEIKFPEESTHSEDYQLSNLDALRNIRARTQPTH